MAAKAQSAESHTEGTNDRSAIRTIFRALRSRNYRLFFGGQGISLVGTWMQATAMSWLVYRLTGSAFLLGAVAFISQIPAAILGPPAGVLADRWDRRRILVMTQTLSMLQAFALAALILTGAIAVWQIVALSLMLGLVNAVDVPARQAFVVDMVESKSDLGNAIALNSFLFNGARIVGPSIAGIVIAKWHEGVCFTLNGVSYLAVIAALLMMTVPPKSAKRGNGRIFREMKEGMAYAFAFKPIRYLLLLIALVSTLVMPYAVLMPVFAKSILHGGASAQGFLMASAGVGALTGAMFLASRHSVLGLGRVVAASSSILGAGLILFSQSRVFALSSLFLVLIGFGMMVTMASCNTLLQTIVEDDKRGRVMSLYTTAFFGAAPVGSLLAGILASRIGAPYAVMICGACCLLGSLVILKKLPEMRKMVRPLYQTMHIIREQ